MLKSMSFLNNTNINFNPKKYKIDGSCTKNLGIYMNLLPKGLIKFKGKRRNTKMSYIKNKNSTRRLSKQWKNKFRLSIQTIPSTIMRQSPQCVDKFQTNYQIYSKQQGNSIQEKCYSIWNQLIIPDYKLLSSNSRLTTLCGMLSIGGTQILTHGWMILSIQSMLTKLRNLWRKVFEL